MERVSLGKSITELNRNGDQLRVPMETIGQPKEPFIGERFVSKRESNSSTRNSMIMLFAILLLIFCTITSALVWKQGIVDFKLNSKNSGENLALQTISGADNNISSPYDDHLERLRNRVLVLENTLKNFTEIIAKSASLVEIRQKISNLENSVESLQASSTGLSNAIQIVNQEFSNYKPGLKSLNSSAVPVGSVHWFPSATCPQYYLELNGAIVSRNLYTTLWAFANSSGALAASENTKQHGQFGPGNGNTTFSLMDLRGLSVRSWDKNRGLDSGRTLGSFQDSQNLLHSHGISDPGHTHYVNDPGHDHAYDRARGQGLAQGGIMPFTIQLVVHDPWPTTRSPTGIWLNSETTKISIQGSGSGETRVPNVALLACIKY